MGHVVVVFGNRSRHGRSGRSERIFVARWHRLRQIRLQAEGFLVVLGKKLRVVVWKIENLSLNVLERCLSTYTEKIYINKLENKVILYISLDIFRFLFQKANIDGV